MPIRFPNVSNLLGRAGGGLGAAGRRVGAMGVSAAGAPFRNPGTTATLGGLGGLAYYAMQPPTPYATPPSSPQSRTFVGPPDPPRTPDGTRMDFVGPPAPNAGGDKAEGFLSKYWPYLAGAGLGGAGLYGLYRAFNKDDDEEKQAAFSRRVIASPSEALRQHPLVSGFLVKCAERGFDDQQISVALTLAADRSPEFKSACINAGLSFRKGASRASAPEARFP